ncbi:hypothetical protein AFULGI_00016100 [Archaeoglobus fulgidus DSM 8774]|uniref:Single-stranded DNA binding protein Ssb-like OB fold domain-containing protein n=1 Tax=Archaeoglobus fulgidus DSM 8774 TaxID=1344584 RepID=A0A075WF02_ARCFL|nr:hypothetical protein [Archaeoglobus fulgidus]AIG98372.1 hypothetical protein AFULGI_00016100 [Archaeoglobus fulgidus DSM 8774]
MDEQELVTRLTNQILSKFKKAGYEIKPKEVSERLRLLLLEFKVPESEAIKTIENYLMKELEISREHLIKAPLVKIVDIAEPGEWVSLKVKVAQLWEPSSESISQAGLIGDETGIIKFVVWSSANVKPVEEGKSYVFRNVVTDYYNGKMQVNVNRSSEIEEIDEEVQLPPREVEVVGALVAIRRNSGLIQRCRECNRPVSKGLCPVHGKTVYDDLRVKGVIDDGENVYEVILNQEIVKSLTGIELEEALQIAREHLDRNAVLSELKNKLLGRYLRLIGTRGERCLVAKEATFLDLGAKLKGTGQEGVGMTGKREPARRVFAFELNSSTYKITDDTKTKYVLTPTGERCNRVFFVGALLEKEEVRPESGIWRIRVADPTGAIIGYVGRFQPDALEALMGIEPPEMVAVVGKVRVLEGERRKFVTVRPEQISIVDTKVRDCWVHETAKSTLERIRRMEEAKESDSDSRLAWQVYNPNLNEYRRIVRKVIEAVFGGAIKSEGVKSTNKDDPIDGDKNVESDLFDEFGVEEEWNLSNIFEDTA